MGTYMYLYVSDLYPYTPYTPYTTYIIPILEPYIHILPYTLYMTDMYVSICQCHISLYTIYTIYYIHYSYTRAIYPYTALYSTYELHICIYMPVPYILFHHIHHI